MFFKKNYLHTKKKKKYFKLPKMYQNGWRWYGAAECKIEKIDILYFFFLWGPKKTKIYEMNVLLLFNMWKRGWFFWDNKVTKKEKKETNTWVCAPCLYDLPSCCQGDFSVSRGTIEQIWLNVLKNLLSFVACSGLSNWGSKLPKYKKKTGTGKNKKYNFPVGSFTLQQTGSAAELVSSLGLSPYWREGWRGWRKESPLGNGDSYHLMQGQMRAGTSLRGKLCRKRLGLNKEADSA